MKYLLVLSIFLFFFKSYAYNNSYEREAEIPEPLLFDLVRRINSDKGELEINTLFTQSGDSKIKELHIAPEIEYAFSKGRAIELELPTVDGKVKTIKGALQFELPQWIGDINGLQLMHEKFVEKSVNETTVLFLMGNRISEKWSVFTMLGNRFVYGSSSTIQDRRMKELPIANINFFYDYAEVFDLGIETNLRGVGSSFEEFIIMPQIHALLARDFKIQAGMGASYDGHTFSTMSAFRLIKEFNE